MKRISKNVALAVGCAVIAAVAIVAWPRVALLADREAHVAVDPGVPSYTSANSVNELFASAR